MSAELIAGLVGLILSLVFGGFGWREVKKHGEVIRERDALREQIREYEQAIDAVLGPDPTLDELARVSAREAGKDA